MPSLLKPDDSRLGKAAAFFHHFLISPDLLVYVVRDRKSKNGDFRPSQSRRHPHVITINQGLGEDSFLLILAHELAHYQVHRDTRFRKQPHGKEWKEAYRQLLFQLIETQALDPGIVSLVLRHARNPKASLSADSKLWTAVEGHRFRDGKVPLESLSQGMLFQLNGSRIFMKLEKRRTRYTCKEMNSGRIYLVSAHAPVKVLET